MKDYYELLDLDQDASEEQIRKAYRGLALRYHPDRNPGDPEAEERFKEIAVAYGVLIDPVKREEYDQWRGLGEQQRMTGGGFRYSQEEIFQDLFKDPRFSRVFQDLLKEFQRAGVRFDQRFFDQVFFGGRGMFFGGVFVWSPFGPGRRRIRPRHQRTQVEQSETQQIQPFGFLKRIGKTIGRYLLGGQKQLSQEASKASLQSHDLIYDLTVPSEDAQRGTWVTITIDRGQGRETLKVKIPPGTRSGTRLRLRGKGMHRVRGTGDLYLTVHLA
ncbi:MAG: J domain-containing protein [Deltaproteobacteria bacterium]|nr:MAG: J domain-containing protein [Deltaproteobacteria bacterium]